MPARIILGLGIGLPLSLQDAPTIPTLDTGVRTYRGAMPEFFTGTGESHSYRRIVRTPRRTLRTTRPASLNHAGRRILRHARQIMQLLACHDKVNFEGLEFRVWADVDRNEPFIDACFG